MKVKEYHDNIENKAIVGRINKDKQYANKHVIKKIKTSQFAEHANIGPRNIFILQKDKTLKYC